MKLGFKKLAVFAMAVLLVVSTMTGCGAKYTHRDTDPEAPQAEVVVNTLSFEEIDDGTFGVRMTESEKENDTITEITIPDNYYGVPVTHIFEDAFSNAMFLESITLPSTIKSIGKNAFANSMIMSMTLPGGVKTVAEGAFSKCSLLGSISLGSSLTAIEKNVFAGCKELTEIELPDSVISIDPTAFKDCSKIKSISLGNGITELPVGSLDSCTGVKTLKLGKNLSTLDVAVFAPCVGLTSITVAKGNETFAAYSGVLYDAAGENILYVPAKLSGEIVFPETLTSIGAEAFKDRTDLKGVKISANLASIDPTAFDGCTALEKITIAKDVTELNADVLALISKDTVATIVVEKDSESFVAQNGVLYDLPTTDILFVPAKLSGDVKILDGVTEIGETEFAHATGVKKVYVNENVTYFETSFAPTTIVIKTEAPAQDAN